MTEKEKKYQQQLHKIVVGKGLTGKSTPKKGEHNQASIDRKNSAAARKKLREEGKSHEYKTKKHSKADLSAAHKHMRDHAK